MCIFNAENRKDFFLCSRHGNIFIKKSIVAYGNILENTNG